MAKTALRKGFEKQRDVHPVGITGSERPADIIARMFPAYVGRQERTAFELMQRSSRDDTCTFLTFSGAMTPAGLHQSCLIPLIERGLIDCITTTGANLYHDAHRIIGHRIREIDPNAGDLAVPPGAHHPHLRPRLLGRDAPRDRQALLGASCASPSSRSA